MTKGIKRTTAGSLEMQCVKCNKVFKFTKIFLQKVTNQIFLVSTEGSIRINDRAGV